MSKVVFLVIVYIFLGLSAIVPGQQRDLRPPLSIDLEIPNTSVCADNPITLVAKIINNSERDIVIDINRVGSTFVFDHILDRGKIDRYKSFAMEFGMPTHYTPKFQLLGSKKSLTKEVDFDPKDASRVLLGKYKLKVGYNQNLDRTFEGNLVWRGTVLSKGKLIIVSPCNKQ